MAFDTADAAGNSVYHTNVIMCVGTEFALIALGHVDKCLNHSRADTISMNPR